MMQLNDIEGSCRGMPLRFLVVGVPHEVLRRGGFAFRLAQLPEGRLLCQPFEPM
jgi:hypothetical protein